MRNRTIFYIFALSIFVVIVRSLFSINKIKEPSATLSTTSVDEIVKNKRPRYNVIFIETNQFRSVFGIRSLCAIESAAKHNPNARIIVKALSAKINVSEMISTYSNIEWSLLDLNEIFKNTPLFEWWKADRLVKDNNYTRFAHLADALRYTLVYKYGGIYSDLDTIALKSFEPLTKYCGFGTNRYDPKGVISNGFFHFTENHPFLFKLLEQLPNVYNPKVWGSIGPLLIRPFTRKYCNVTSFEELMHLGINLPEMYQPKFDSKTKIPQFRKATQMKPCNISVYPYYVLYPFQMDEMPMAFTHNGTLKVYYTIHTYSVHFFGKLSEHSKVHWNEYSIFEFFAQSNCPITYSLLQSKSNIEKLI